MAIQNDSSLPVHLFTSFDNLGSDATGRNALSATITTDSLLGLNELIAITRRQSAFPFSGEHRSDSTAVLMQFPWGYNTLSVNYSQSHYINGLSLPGGVKLKLTEKVITGIWGQIMCCSVTSHPGWDCLHILTPS